MMLSGCQTISGSVTDLMSPPKLTAEQQSIENALNRIKGTGKYELKYPTEGEYRSAFILHNLDGDPGEEAIALYCPITDNAGTHVMILKKTKGRWQEINDFNGGGGDVDQIAFGDFYGSGHDDIAIAWTQLTGTDLQLSVYQAGSKQYYTYGDTFSAMKIVDLNGDGRQDVMLLKLDQAARKAYATLISCKGGNFMQLGTTPMDSTVSGYAGIYATKVDGQNAVLVDGYKGQHGMVTELVLWKDGTLRSPWLDAVQKTVSLTLRDLPVTCEDFYQDGEYEVPSADELPGYAGQTDFSKKRWCITWSNYSGGELKPQFSSVMNSSEGYYFVIPKKWETDGNKTDVTVDNSKSDSRWDFKVWNGTKATDLLFSIRVYSESDWEKLEQSEYDLNGTYELADVNGLVYVAAINTKAASDSQYLSFSDIKANFRLMK